ncbi:GNAT family N-acetyltransferase [Candidatus Berkiella aquae]|uniref:GNAT family N-acetyltransferase n=1 Tax=Candidatus Berkiella aquae TaxID=295108 RepID=A0A0Q9YJZ7_9GAMM|nr:GNAT family N-acetyltransferase [Candidatus Berkiella aquae]MCS5709968.1 GNAT family N-acetyltransferase [Candidatus Berkiella aquae]
MKHEIVLTQCKLVAASLEDYPTMQNMGRFYVYDMSEYIHDDGWSMPDNGLYECIDFKKYWQTEHAWPYFIRYNNELAGFVIIDKKGFHATTDFNMAQFYILRRFKGLGLGKYIAHFCFEQYKGNWEVMVIPSNIGAYQFWQKCIQQYTDDYKESHQVVSHLQNSEKIIFRFSSKP